MKRSTKQILFLIFFITLALRLFLAFTIPNFTYDSYFHLRQTEQIAETGIPLYSDDLSYGGRELRFLPFFHYFAAFFALFLPLELVAKIIPNLLFAILPLLVYFISKELTNNDSAALFSAFISGFLPILFSTNSFNTISLFLPLIFLAIYSFLKIKEKNFLYIYIASFLILSITSSATFLLLIGFGIYLLLSLIEDKKINRAEVEIIIFSLFFFVWTQFLFFKDTLLQEGISFIWQNIPPQIIQQYFPQVSIIRALVLVGIIPFFIGILVTYQSLFKFKNKKSFLIISLVVSTTLLAWLRLIRFQLSLSFFAITLAILFAFFYQEAIAYIKKTKLERWQNLFFFILIILLILTVIYPAVNASLQQETPGQNEVDTFQWLEQEIPADSIVLASLEEGHLLTYYSHKKNVMDDRFALIPDVEKRFNDLNIIFTTTFQTQAIDLLDVHNVDYIVLTPHTKEKYNLGTLKYLTPECFERIHKDEIKIYQVKCILGDNNEKK